jgi:hypothetical protein
MIISLPSDSITQHTHLHSMESHRYRTVKTTPPQSLASDPHVSVDIRNGVTPSPALAHPHCKVMDVESVEASSLPVAPGTIPSPLRQGVASSSTAAKMAENQAPIDDPRRSSRQRISTVIQIDGHTVLKQNNYVLKGLGYAYGDNTMVAKPKPQKRPPARSQEAPSRKAPRVQTAAETARQTHNSKIKRRIAQKAIVRMQHLAKQQDILKPFLDDLTRVKLLTLPVPILSEPNREIFLQPEAIQADMRDYQLAGLNWMVKMHDKNLGMIL